MSPASGPAIRGETPADREAIRAVHRDAFGRDAEADLVDRLRAGGYSRISLVAEADGRVVGHVLLGALSLRRGDRDTPALALAPLAVRPEAQSQGIGTALVRAALAACAGRPEAAVVVLGEPAYYGRFGFTPEAAAALRCPFPGAEWAFQSLVLDPAALAGAAGAEVIYPPPFAELE